MRVRDLPPQALIAVDPETSLAEVARRMRLDDTDSVAVMAEGRLLGIITEHTVQDHLKAIFDKFGVHSRGQLVAAIFGGHYLPLMMGSRAALELRSLR